MSKIIIANWKMNPRSQKEAETLFQQIAIFCKNFKENKVIICPSFPHLYIYKKLKIKKILLGAQDVSVKAEGASTGEVSPTILKDMQVQYVIVGHSERRMMKEDDDVINKKIINLLKFNLKPIICIGEKKRDHDGFFLSYVREQIKSSLIGISGANMKNIIITYEPVWAIGEKAEREATVSEFIEMKIFIKKTLADLYSSKIAHSIPIIYGGSVNSINARSFLIEGQADGLLIGRDSLNHKKFGAILEVAQENK